MTNADEAGPRVPRRPLARGVSLRTGTRGQAAVDGLRRTAARGGLGPGAPLPAGTRGQAAVELIALLPLVALIAAAALTLLASHVAAEQAGEAAEAGALAVLQGGLEPEDAAEQALPASARRRAAIRVAGNRVHVRVRPRIALPIPGLADRLAGEARVQAGP